MAPIIAMQKVNFPGPAIKALVPRSTSTRAARAVRVKAAAEAEAKDRLSPLEKGGTLKGAAALGKDAAAAAKAVTKANGTYLSIKDGRFVDDRWINGTWDMEKFKNAEGEVDYDKVISKRVYPIKYFHWVLLDPDFRSDSWLVTSELVAFVWSR
jgi:hypothetical protein